LTRPDIATAVGFLAWHMQKPGKTHWNALLQVLRYLQGTTNYGLVYYQKDSGDSIEVFCDSDWARDHKDHKSTTGYIILFNGTAISHKNTRQTGVLTSTLEAKYIVLATTMTEVLWLCSILQETGFATNGATMIHSDNDGAMITANISIITPHTKHIDI
jgi:hypothetical protein